MAKFIISCSPDHSQTIVISPNSRGYDTQFLLRKFLELSWTLELIMDGSKILCMIVEYMQFLDSLDFL